MCGRYTLTSPAQLIAEAFGALPPSVSWRQRYNITPGTNIPVIRSGRESGRVLDDLYWGLVPSWMKQRPKDSRMINARSETVAEKPSFRAAFSKRRCLVPADGFYEWKKERSGRQPYLMRRPDRQPFAMAGLWETWKDSKGELLESCAVLTTSPNRVMADIHDRMPVILDAESCEIWLSPDTSQADLQAALVPAPDALLEAMAVTKRINNPRNDDSLCFEPLDSLAATESGSQRGLF